ncbi:unnamed protein product [Didymodactylos carnosus]|uniref:Uncharacterized protein n=1 Tax=Didymodactylos carnosus TaxID=1234261 RepID=A0A8S2Z863_9BILA|nr:unnamed protein product [Didymodactylos carnosus]
MDNDQQGRNEQITSILVSSDKKLAFENQQKPSEIKILNEIAKANQSLSLLFARYSHSQEHGNELLIFANNSSTFEHLCERNKWPQKLCGLSYDLIPPNKVPVCHSIKDIPKEWEINDVAELIREIYPSVTDVKISIREITKQQTELG